MIVYLDTNVYDFIAKEQETEKVSALLRQRRIVVLASEFHLCETISISNNAIRKEVLRTITSLALKYDEAPIAWRHARELRFEIVRCRPNWLRRCQFKNTIPKLLSQHKLFWKRAQSHELSKSAFAKYHKDSEAGIGKNSAYQKFLRSGQATVKKPKIYTNRWVTKDGPIDFNLEDPEAYWRDAAATAWHQAIIKCSPASRDYADYLNPFLTENAFDDTYARFWHSEVIAARMPLTRITGLAEFYQLQQKITHGNSFDALHSNYLFGSDLFLTADKGFFNVLTRIYNHTPATLGMPVFIDRNSTDVCAELAQKLDGAISMRKK